MGNDVMLGSVYLLMAAMLVFAALISRRESLARMLTYALAWIAIFGAGFVLFTFRDNLEYVWQRLRAEATGAPVHEGREIRVPMALDGHFWITGTLNGVKVKFLVDSGATMTTVDQAIATRAHIDLHDAPQQIVKTGNGFVRVSVGHVREFEVGPMDRRDFAVHVTSNGDDLNVLGMNFLSTLQSWGVEGRWLVMVS
jgi:aspartyl protease family protein